MNEPSPNKSLRALVLGSQRGIRWLDPSRSYPFALETLPGVGTVLTWVMSALKTNGVSQFYFVAGYHIEKVVEAYPELHYFFHARWQAEGLVGAIRTAATVFAAKDDLLITTSTVVFRPAAVAEMEAARGDLVIGLTSASDGTFGLGAEGEVLSECGEMRGYDWNGMLLIRGAAAARFFEIAEEIHAHNPRAEMTELLRAWIQERRPTFGVDLAESSQSVLNHRGLTRFVLGTKGETLERLRTVIRGAVIPPVHRFQVREWVSDPDAVLRTIRGHFSDARLVIRSSSLLEDNWNSSSAGMFHSELNVAPEQLQEAVERVIESYRFRDRTSLDDQVLVQPFVATAVANGVLFTRNPDDLSPYRVLTWEDAVGRTDTVTAGSSARTETLIRYRGAGLPEDDSWQSRILRLSAQIEELVHHDALDLEFAVDASSAIYLFQVRPIAEKARVPAFTDEDLRTEIDSVRKRLEILLGPAPWMQGTRSVMGIMPDWNPAEIIGTCPRPLALSLYRHLVTDSIWAQARARIGYRDPDHTPLVVSLSGRPYVDVRASLNSFLPMELPLNICQQAVDFGIDRLIAHPHLHDKIEFEIIATCHDLDMGSWRELWQDSGWSSDTIAVYLASLRDLTESFLKGRHGTPASWMAAMEPMRSRRTHWLEGNLEDSGRLLGSAWGLLEDCRRWGTLPFSVLARYAFVAITLLRSLERIGVFSAAERGEILAGIPTVASRISVDLARHQSGEISRDDFLREYGHLRPGTYDVLSPSYAEEPDLYLSGNGASGAENEPSPEKARGLLYARRSEIGEALRNAGFSVSAEEVIAFVLESIPAREEAKFEFTRNLSASISLMVRAGESFDLSRDDLSFLPCTRLLSLAVETPSAAEQTELHRLADLGRKRFEITTSIRLPHLITRPEEIDQFRLPQFRPNFITRKRVTGELYRIQATAVRPDGSPAGRIVLIENADPGFDWIFGHPIIGLITKHGGMASHMAIRAAEFELPAAIGCGETIFHAIENARLVDLDCAAEEVRVIR